MTFLLSFLAIGLPTWQLSLISSGGFSLGVYLLYLGSCITWLVLLLSSYSICNDFTNYKEKRSEDRFIYKKINVFILILSIVLLASFLFLFNNIRASQNTRVPLDISHTKDSRVPTNGLWLVRRMPEPLVKLTRGEIKLRYDPNNRKYYTDEARPGVWRLVARPTSRYERLGDIELTGSRVYPLVTITYTTVPVYFSALLSDQE